MRRSVTLYEFMPYGAPELIESRPRHMGRALLLTSAVALALTALTGGLASLVPVAPVAPRSVAVEPENYVIPLAPVPVTPSSPVPVATPAVHAAAEPVPVREEPAPTSEAVASSPVRTDEAGAGVAPTPTGTAITGAATETLPSRGDYVYVEELPVAVREVRPEYPDLARQAGVEGPVTVFVLVGREGRVLDAALSEKVQVPMLNAAALEAARRWVFTPGLANGKPVACWTAIPFRFRLN